MTGRHRSWLVAHGFCLLALGSCARPSGPPTRARNLVLITIDTLRADRVGAYGYKAASTPALDSIAAAGVRFDRAYAAAPITLPSHATILTGRYPPGHGSRDNGMPVSSTVPTLAAVLKALGFRTGAFVAAFPLDHQFGLNRGFDVYGDQLPRSVDGRQQNERPASAVVEEALAWLGDLNPQSAVRSSQFFLWVHLFEPHAPYGDPTTGRSIAQRYDDEIATADRAVARLLAAIAPVLDSTVVIAAGDHGEAFGEHGEHAHSIFVYDTTLRVPLLMRGPGVAPGIVGEAVTLADVAPTAAKLLGSAVTDVDGVDLSARPVAARELYAESFAPLVEFGWAPLRSVRAGSWKFIAAPKPELYDIRNDADEAHNVVAAQAADAERLDKRVARYGAAQTPSLLAGLNPDSAERLRALGYVGAGSTPSTIDRPDPKDRREAAAAMAQVTAGELRGADLIKALEAIARSDPRNGQAHMRLGFARIDAGDCARAEPELRQAIALGLPTVDAHLGLATCLGRRGDLAEADRVLADARRREPDNAIITANVGILHAARGDFRAAIDAFTGALAKDPNIHEARFNLAVAYAKTGRRAEAAAQARELLARLPPSAPQRAEIERLLRAVQ
ncbi:MAG TPA: sulfatase-like hydrolase/transferase [Vicinamibacterales bacterium]|nr:sulfatase-like hydrolase/transferase [Vicinamibacterales bacterium]